MVRYSTGHKLFSAVYDFSSWLSDVTSPADDSDVHTTLLKAPTTPEAPVVETLLPPQEVETVLGLGLDGASLLRTCFAGWQAERNLAATRQGAAEEELRRNEVLRQALSTWFLAPDADEPLLRTSLCAWLDVAVSAQTLRAMQWSQQRASFSFERQVSESSTSRPMMQALGALLSASEEPLVRGCFLAWWDCSKETKRRTVLLRWLMERWALSQSSLALQAALRSWHHCALQSRQPAWALDLQRDVTNLLRKQHLLVQEDEPSSTEDSAPVGQRPVSVAKQSTSPNVVLTLLIASVTVHLLLLTLRAGPWSSAPFPNGASGPGGASILVDSDGDGIADSADRCPYTPKHLGFRSTWQSDWDRDGCSDVTEDLDDDNDMVPDSQDKCPQTPFSDGAVNSGGCSVRQLQLLRGTDMGNSSYSGLSAGKLSDILLEVTIGGVITAAVNYAWRHGPRALRLWQYLQGQGHRLLVAALS